MTLTAIVADADIAALAGTRQLDGDRSEAQSRDTKSSGRMALALWSGNPRTRRERYLSTKRGLGCSCHLAEPSLVMVDEDPILERTHDEITSAICQAAKSA